MEAHRMKYAIAFLLLCVTASADDFRWQITDAPSFSWTITIREGGDLSSTPSATVAEVQDAPNRTDSGTASETAAPESVSLAPGVAGVGAPVAPATPSHITRKPKITITSPASFACPACETLKRYDWSGFDVTWVSADTEPVYPTISWTGANGVRQVLRRAYRPDQVRWSWERTQ
jgi:hypothetical protein